MPTSIDSLQQISKIFPPKANFQQNALISSQKQYDEMYQRSLSDPNFWLEQAETLAWFQKPTKGLEYRWDTKKRSVEHTCFKDGTLNLSVNCLDRHLKNIPNQTAIIWQGEKDEEVKHVSYAELHKQVCQFSNVLENLGIKKGDRVCLYLPMIPEAAVAMLACARIGAIHSIVFAGFSADALASRIDDSGSVLLITADIGYRGGKEIPLLQIAEEALGKSSSVKNTIVVGRKSSNPSKPTLTLRGGFLKPPLKIRGGGGSYEQYIWDQLMSEASPIHQAQPMNSEDPLFILYTSGSTGKPKGVLHTTGGYLLHVSLTHKYIFDYHPGQIYWCTADIGWVTGHSYLVYGPLANGATSLMFEGVPTFPDAGRFWQVIEKHKVNIFYTAPTAIRALIREGTTWPQKYDLSSLKVLGSVGEPINPEAWIWYYENIGHQNCPVVDTWWQTETGGMLIAPFPGIHTLKPGSACRPFFGVEPVVLRDDGSECGNNEGGKLCIKKPWPGMMRTTWGDHDRFIDTYFSIFPNYYFTGDGCRIDEDGDYWLLGRIDDVVNVSGHRIGTAEVESALVSHATVAEAAVVAMPHDIKGQGLYAFVTLKDGQNPSDDLKKQLIQHVRKEIGAIAQPDIIQFAPQLPKTRSGKIMRRILRKIAEGDTSNIGDTSTLADPTIVDSLLKNAQNLK